MCKHLRALSCCTFFKTITFNTQNVFRFVFNIIMNRINFMVLRHITIIYLTYLQNVKSIRFTLHDLQPKQLFQQIMNLTLKFDPMNLTISQLLVLIDVCPHTNFGFNQTNSKLDIDNNVFALQTDGRKD